MAPRVCHRAYVNAANLPVRQPTKPMIAVIGPDGRRG